MTGISMLIRYSGFEGISYLFRLFPPKCIKNSPQIPELKTSLSVCNSGNFFPFILVLIFLIWNGGGWDGLFSNHFHTLKNGSLFSQFSYLIDKEIIEVK